MSKPQRQRTYWIRIVGSRNHPGSAIVRPLLLTREELQAADDYYRDQCCIRGEGYIEFYSADPEKKSGQTPIVRTDA